jgi:hypothetical protein
VSKAGTRTRSRRQSRLPDHRSKLQDLSGLRQKGPRVSFAEDPRATAWLIAPSSDGQAEPRCKGSSRRADEAPRSRCVQCESSSINFGSVATSSSATQSEVLIRSGGSDVRDHSRNCKARRENPRGMPRVSAPCFACSLPISKLLQLFLQANALLSSGATLQRRLGWPLVALGPRPGRRHAPLSPLSSAPAALK